MKESEYRNGTFELGRWTDDLFRLRVEDKASGLTVFEAYIDPASLALAMGGRGAMPIRFAETRPAVAPLVGKYRTVRTVMLPAGLLPEKPPSFIRNKEGPDIEAARKAFWKHCEDAALAQCHQEDGQAWREGWRLFDDGSRSQQNVAGLHRVTLERYDGERLPEAPDGVFEAPDGGHNDNPPRKRR